MSTETEKEASPPTVAREEFYCPVCLELAYQPFRLRPCDHFLCKECLHGLKSTHSFNNCPLCRASIVISVPYKALELKMARLEETCPGCQKKVALYTMKEHVMNCCVLRRFETYSDQINPGMSKHSRLPPQRGSREDGQRDRGSWRSNCPTGQERLDSGDEAQSVSGASQTTHVGDFDPSQGAIPKSQPKPKKRSSKKFDSRHLSQSAESSTSSACENASAASSHNFQNDNGKYICPYCGASGLPQYDLLKHCLSQHASDERQVVCPICASMPWGNPNQTSPNFMAHLHKRHRFDYKNYNVNDDDESMLRMALDASLQMN